MFENMFKNALKLNGSFSMFVVVKEDLTENVIISPTIALEYRENVGPRNKRGSF